MMIERQSSESSPGRPEAESRSSLLKNRRLRGGLWIAAIFAVLALAAFLIYYELRGQYFESTNNAYLRADTVTVSAKIPGYVSAVLVRDNQLVQAGQQLVRIESRTYLAQQAQSRAEITVAEANLDSARALAKEQTAIVERARADLAGATHASQYADAQIARYAPLGRTGAESQDRVLGLRNDAAQAADLERSRRASAQAAAMRSTSLRAQIQQAAAQADVARSQSEASNINLNATVVRASVAGTIGQKTVRIGQYVQPGTRMMSVVPTDAIYVVANFKETQIGRMRAGQPVTVRVDALPGMIIKGQVDSIAPATGAELSLIPPQNATGNFTKIVQRVPVRISLHPTAEVRRALIAGLSVTVTVDTISSEHYGDRSRGASGVQATLP